MERLFVLKTLSRTQRATKICGDLPETTAFKSYAANQYSDLPAVSFQRSARGYPTIVNNIRPCPKRCLLKGAFLEKSSGGSSSRAEGPHPLYIAHTHITPVMFRIIAERLSARQLILRRISEIVCMYVCMYVCIRHA